MLQRLRGFRDMYPEYMRARRIVFDKICSVARSFGFHEIDSPSVELLDLFRIKSGEEIVKQTFSFMDKGGREITLIPELTPSVARMIAARKDLTKPVKWFSFPKMWRYEEPQSGRLREFYQFNADIFGVSEIYADAEVMALAMEILDSLGLEGKYTMRFSDRILMENMLRSMHIDNIEEAFRIIDKKDKIPEEVFYEEMKKITSEENVDTLLDILRISGDIDAVLSKLEHFERSEVIANLKDLLSAYGKRAVFDLSIVRGLAYYTGIVFEVHDARGEYRAILGGGRYDGVVELFGAQHTPAVGFGMGDAVLELLMRREGVWPEEKIDMDYFVAIIPGFREEAIKVAMQLRKKGYRVDIELRERSIGKQMKYANKINARYVIIVGEEIKSGEVVLKDMESGEQKVVKVENIGS
ncbi:MAG: histidine--tRNA ligase [Thermoplasmata archaeon]|nr:histidine--tRNA ligase [Thermoplasmata archaeon]